MSCAAVGVEVDVLVLVAVAHEHAVDHPQPWRLDDRTALVEGRDGRDPGAGVGDSRVCEVDDVRGLVVDHDDVRVQPDRSVLLP